MSQHAVFCEFNGQRQRIGTATQAEDGSFVVVLGGFLVIGKAEAGTQRQTPSSRPASGGAVFPPFGRSKGAPIQGASMQDLSFYANAALRTLNDPAKSRWHDKERGLLDAINAEIVAQGGTPVHVREEYGQPHPTDGIGGDRFGQTEQDDIPF